MRTKTVYPEPDPAVLFTKRKMRYPATTMATVKAPTLAASVNRLIVARATLPGEPPRVDFRTAQKPDTLHGFEALPGAPPSRRRHAAHLFARLFRSLSLFY